MCPGGAAFAATILLTHGDARAECLVFQVASAPNAAVTPGEPRNARVCETGHWNAAVTLAGWYLVTLGHLRTTGAAIAGRRRRRRRGAAAVAE